MQPLIGISTNFRTVDGGKFIGMEQVYVNKDYIEAVEKSGGIPLLLPPVSGLEAIQEYVRLCHGFILSGGGDINPLLYGCTPHPKLEAVNTGLDQLQLLLVSEILKTDKPLLAICRGAQLLNVALGGTLYQDMSEVPFPVMLHSQIAPRGDRFHAVALTEDSIPGSLFGHQLWVNSFHHQSIKELGKGLRVVAVASDGIVEAVQSDEKSFVLGIQWHPEMMLVASGEMLPLFCKFIDSCK
ncbi:MULTISPECIES: gamma-glutamyl-gamma-aminobutyrate hydrolase family protein [Culturomica]|jgi:putative glutamine amidotransferase|uniref:gamma-glutamyl-gamma-aminobutyrate hydrolase family protein n=1 Tax=Culturomica TaxID=1926651 RepID=UPI0008385069|nr:MULTISPECIES: gamma-glutamyl-gamma-aminobutyrate hydrolase family protein [Odoribacteraceae]RHV95374.1 gamma-glutamyl-gamma-aminobutyrate hydrolase family protein [Odoribacter sp. OF09-27XD]HBO27227.1 gamma-glutamyl-gamma-aminobutyrate hydrolase [Culturomica sp.]